MKAKKHTTQKQAKFPRKMKKKIKNSIMNHFINLGKSTSKKKTN